MFAYITEQVVFETITEQVVFETITLITLVAFIAALSWSFFTRKKMFVICGQDVRQQGGELNTELLSRFIEVSAPGDWAIFTGTPLEKDVFLNGLTISKRFRVGKVSLCLYACSDRTICALDEHHSQKSIHNCVEALWAFSILETFGFSNWTAIHGLMYDKSQGERTKLILGEDQSGYKAFIEQAEHISTDLPLKQCLDNMLLLNDYWTTDGPDFMRLLKERSDEHGLAVSDMAFRSMLSVFRNVDKCFHIGSSAKVLVEQSLIYKYGAGYNYADICDLLPMLFEMDGNRKNGASNATDTP
jgi:hypothetical protein